MKGSGVFWTVVAVTVVLAAVIAVLAVIVIMNPAEAAKLTMWSVVLLPVMLLTMLAAILLRGGRAAAR